MQHLVPRSSQEWTLPCHGRDRGFKSLWDRQHQEVGLEAAIL